MNLRNRMAGIDTNLDDLQSGLEACTRAAEAIKGDAEAVDRLVYKLTQRADSVGLLVKRAEELQACVLDQSGALRELRQNIALLCEELKLSHTAQRRDGAGDRRNNSRATRKVSSPSRE